MPERGRPKHPDVLTPRQFEVLELLRQGLTNPQIAERLGISPDGAKWHVKEILWKLDVPSREEAARWQREHREAAPTARLGTWRVAQPSMAVRSRQHVAQPSPAVRAPRSARCYTSHRRVRPLPYL
ncbi:MAG: helix-turn-helix transcriptional regulator [Chloroflexi bacterium]|nr:helix-turn-helix transcriptional regulator [Chloroflexota bacterium]